MNVELPARDVAKLLEHIGTEIEFKIGPVTRTMNLRKAQLIENAERSDQSTGSITLEEVDAICKCSSCGNLWLIHTTGEVIENFRRVLHRTYNELFKPDQQIHVSKGCAMNLANEHDRIVSSFDNKKPLENWRDLERVELYGAGIVINEGAHPAFTIGTKQGCMSCTMKPVMNFALAE